MNGFETVPGIFYKNYSEILGFDHTTPLEHITLSYLSRFHGLWFPFPKNESRPRFYSMRLHQGNSNFNSTIVTKFFLLLQMSSHTNREFPQILNLVYMNISEMSPQIAYLIQWYFSLLPKATDCFQHTMPHHKISIIFSAHSGATQESFTN